MALTNKASEDFKKLERFCTYLDLCIDDEDYIAVENSFDFNDPLVKERLHGFFGLLPACTINAGWPGILGFVNVEADSGSVTALNGSFIVTYEGISIPVTGDWVSVLYSKLLWAMIQQRSDSDCYSRRFDDVTSYLEKNLPCYREGDDTSSRMMLLYLMELSAICLGSESQGYSERARRIISEAKYHCLKEERETYDFYELWARYNIGVAYFHQGKYRLAVLEFNRIIWEVDKWQHNISQEFFRGVNGYRLLLLPAKLYRAEVQLKLQMGYHTLKTLLKHELNYPLEEYRQWGSEHQGAKASLIKTQAYQQLGRLDKSWDCLKQVYPRIFGFAKELQERDDVVFPEQGDIKRYPSLGERCFDILIEEHLQWLLLEGEEDITKKSKDELLVNLRYIVKYPSIQSPASKSNNYCTAVNNIQQYLEKLNSKGFQFYWKQVEYNAVNRRGYFQQLAKYLQWLAKAAGLKLDQTNDEILRARRVIANIAKDIYYWEYDNNVTMKSAVLEREPGLEITSEISSSKCLYCGTKGIDLRRIDDEHYAWFTDAMLEFFNSNEISDSIKERKFEAEKNSFIERMMLLERKARSDLRINDLKLHYKYLKPEELINGCRECWKIKGGKALCWQGVSPRGFSGLLQCASGHESSETKFDASNYEKIIQNWDEYFFRHLEYASVHKEDIGNNQFYFAGLQRWNSSSPAKGYSIGGGYLLYHLDVKRRVDLGIVIDPGFDFVRNLFHSGFSLDDIDIILISHAHVDHIRDFESIIMLLSELKNRRKKERRVHVVLSLGAYKRLEYIIESPSFRYLIEPYIVDIEREIDEDYFEKLDKKNGPDFRYERIPSNSLGNDRLIERFRAILPDVPEQYGYHIKIVPTRAYHNDSTNYSDSFGFKIKLRNNLTNEDSEITFGYTGDTKWIYDNMPDPIGGYMTSGRKYVDIAEQYIDCDVLVVHLGSLIKKDNKTNNYLFSVFNQCSQKNEYPCESQVCEENHPYLIGILRFLSSLSYKISKQKNRKFGAPLILVSEFGEELKGNIRADFINRLQITYKDRLSFLPVDVGVIVDLKNRVESVKSHKSKCNCRVWCVLCQEFVDIEDVEFELYGPDHALYCICRTCQKSVPLDVKQEKLHELYETGYEIKTRKEEDNVGS